MPTNYENENVAPNTVRVQGNRITWRERHAFCIADKNENGWEMSEQEYGEVSWFAKPLTEAMVEFLENALTNPLAHSAA